MKKISLKQLIERLSAGIEAVESELLEVSLYHGKRVALLCNYIGRELQYQDEHLFNLTGAGLLHDNALTEYFSSEQPGSNQQRDMKLHCIKGEKNCGFFPFQGGIEGYVLYHHERADGSGAFGKKASQYPQEAGIIALADRMDVNFQLWREETNKAERMIAHIKEYRGTWYEEKIADAAVAVFEKIDLKSFQEDAIVGILSKEMEERKSTISNREMIQIAGMIAGIIDYKSVFTKDHTMQIANKAWYMSGILKFDEDLRARIYLAAALHDIGKLYIPTKILEKPGKLTEEEFEIIKSHVYYTWKCFYDVEGFEEICNWAANHHEKLDGSGYPFGKKAEELDYVSRLIACLDIYQAVSEVRPYHSGRSHKETIRIMQQMAARNIIDAKIVEMMDIYLVKLEGGRAENPIL